LHIGYANILCGGKNMTSKRIAMQVKESEKKEYDKAAKDRDKTLTALVKDALELYIGIPPDFLDQINTVAKYVRLPISTVICHMIIKRAAFDAAWLEVFGFRPPGTFKEFRFDENGLITGDMLGNQLKAESIELLKNLNLDEFDKHSKEALALYFSEK